MKEASAHQPAIHGIHVAINHVAGAVGIRKVEGQEEGILLGTELFDGFKGCATDRLSGPSEKVSDLSTEVGRCRGMVDVPDLLLDGWIECFQSFFAASRDLDEGVQEALDNCDGGKKRQPSVLGCLPTVSVDCYRCIVGHPVVSLFSNVP